MTESTFSRQWKLLQCLCESPQGLSVDEIAKEMHCGRRTVLRDLQLFRELDVSLVEEAGARGKKTYRIATKPGTLSFTYDEVAAVYIGRRFLTPMMGTYFWKAMQGALKKMRACLGTSMIRHLERSVGVIEQTAFGWSDYREAAEIIDELNFAIEEKRQISILYQTFEEQEPSTTTVDPYGIAFHEGSLYLVGFSHKRNDIRHWKIDRIQGITVSNDSFPTPKDFDLSKHIAKMFGIFKESIGLPTHLVRIRFQAYFAQEAREKHWHPTQRFIDQADGSVILEMNLAELAVLKRWVLGFGRHAEVLEPAELRELVLKEIEDTAVYYKKPQT